MKREDRYTRFVYKRERKKERERESERVRERERESARTQKKRWRQMGDRDVA